MHERRDGMQAVKQKMRVQLHLQGLELCLSETFFQFRGLQFMVPKFAIIVEGKTDSNDDPVDEQIKVPRFDQQGLKCLGKTGFALPTPDPRAENHVRDRKRQAGGDMNGHAESPGFGFKWKSSGEPHHWDGKHGKHVPISQCKVYGLLPADICACFPTGDVELKSE